MVGTRNSHANSSSQDQEGKQLSGSDKDSKPGKPVSGSQKPSYSAVVSTASANIRNSAASNSCLNTSSANSDSVFNDPVNVEDPVPCKICKLDLDSGASGKAVACDKCDGWIHLSCSNLSPSEYKLLQENSQGEGKGSIKWHCQLCEEDLKTLTANPFDIILKQSNHIEILTYQVKILQKGLTEVLNTLKGNKTEEKTVEKVVHTQVIEAIDDSKERDEKKTNIILFNVPEPSTKEAKAEKEEDLTSINKIIKETSPDEDDFTPLETSSITRLGGRREGSARPRPIRVTLDSTEAKWTVVRRAKNLKKVDAFKDITIQSDKTKKELNNDRKLKADCNQKRKETGKDYIIFAQEIMLRDDVPSFKRSRQYRRENPNIDDKERKDNTTVSVDNQA